MQVETLALRLRPRTLYEASDLGTRLCQRAARSVYRCHLAVTVPLAALALASFEIRPWLPTLVLWWAKPWLDRTVLFVLSRAAFGRTANLTDLWRAQRQVWWSQLLLTWTWRRLSPWRSFTQPVYQLEGLHLRQYRKRVLQVRARTSWSAALMTSAFSGAELALSISLLSLLFWFQPGVQQVQLSSVLTGDEGTFFALASSAAYALVIAFLEPFYVAAGFGMYLQRRAELEAWDIEQEFRRAFGG